MIDHPSYTTLWEGWGIGEEGFGGGSINHAWSGGPLTLMSQYFAGLAPTAPGFSRYHVLPHPGSLHELSAEIQTRHGRIAMMLHREESTETLTLDSPLGTRAVMGLPLQAGRTFTTIRLNDLVVWQGGHEVPLAPDLRNFTALGITGSVTKHFCFEVPPGHWELQADTRATH